MRAALTIAGSDPSGGAGIQADLKVFHQFGLYGEAVITLLTVQNTVSASRVMVLPADLVSQQLEAVLEDISPYAVKTGALGSQDVVRAVARLAQGFSFPLVVDPVLVGKHGQDLLSGITTLREALIPIAALVTPNIPEAEALSGIAIRGPEDVRRAAECIQRSGVRAVLVKGGHAEGPATDVLLCEAEWHEFTTPRLETRHTHGTGCTYSAAITAGLALGWSIPEAVRRAKQYVHDAIRTAPGLGRGYGPLNHHAKVEPQSC